MSIYWFYALHVVTVFTSCLTNDEHSIYLRCIVFGAGNYALLAAKINTKGARQCLIRHYPDESHPLVLRTEFFECNERWDLIPTMLETKIPDLPEYHPIKS